MVGMLALDGGMGALNVGRLQAGWSSFAMNAGADRFARPDLLRGAGGGTLCCGRVGLTRPDFRFGTGGGTLF